ncbi:hypothetical protein AcW1_008872 [Taiwanofungus camphoratus]|nr:hypothetical protein AcW1_008872 [Antrodia cinnamomea]
MSLHQAHQKAKKRKHAVAEIGLETEPSTKRARKDGKVKTKDRTGKQDKGKARAGAGESEFRVVQASMVISIPPVFANNLRAGVEDMLDSLVMRYIPALQGVVLTHGNLQFIDSTATIKADCPFANCRIGFDATVWSPQVGMKLVGKVNLCSPDHIALLVHRTFNVSIPRHHIPTDQWEFEYGPAENDPEFGPGAAEEIVTKENHVEGMEGTGRWVHKVTAAELGGDDGYLEFTIVGLTIANQMLSLVGSVQLDPFAPEHVPEHTTAVSTNSQNVGTSARPFSQTGGTLVEDAPDAEMDDEGDSLEDTFDRLGRLGDEAVALEAERRAQEMEAAKKERKRDRKEARLRGVHDGADASKGGHVPAGEKKVKKRKKG